MTNCSKSLACWALVALLGTAHGLSAQTNSKPGKKTQRVEDSEAKELNALLASAQAAMDKKDYAAAAQNYEAFLAKRPDDANVHFQLGYAYTSLERMAEARKQYEQATALDPKMGAAYLNLGLTLLDSEPRAAIEPLKKATELLPLQAEPKYVLGTAYERSGNAAQAIAEYREAVQLDAKNVDVHVALGRVLLAAKRAAEAESEFRAAVQLQSESGPAHLGLAQSLIAQKKPELAAEELSAFLRVQPNDSDARMERASLLSDLGKNDEALAELDRLPTPEQDNLRVLKVRARICFHMKKYDEAARVLEKAAALAPEDANLPVQLGQVYLDKKDYPNAVRTLVAAYKMNPTDNEVLGNLVAAEYLNKNYGAALKGLEVLSKREKLPLGTLFIRATCYDKLGQPAEALDAYQKFLADNKDETSDMYFEAAARARFLTRVLKEKKK